MKINYTLDLSRFNLVELDCFLAEGVITVDEFEKERKERGLNYDVVTPPE